MRHVPPFMFHQPLLITRPSPLAFKKGQLAAALCTRSLLEWQRKTMGSRRDGEQTASSNVYAKKRPTRPQGHTMPCIATHLQPHPPSGSRIALRGKGPSKGFADLFPLKRHLWRHKTASAPDQGGQKGAWPCAIAPRQTPLQPPKCQMKAIR